MAWCSSANLAIIVMSLVIICSSRMSNAFENSPTPSYCSGYLADYAAYGLTLGDNRPTHYNAERLQISERNRKLGLWYGKQAERTPSSKQPRDTDFALGRAALQQHVAMRSPVGLHLMWSQRKACYENIWKTFPDTKRCFRQEEDTWTFEPSKCPTG